MLSYFFFFKQKTAYEMRISDWSSDVCSSDLRDQQAVVHDGSQPARHFWCAVQIVQHYGSDQFQVVGAAHIVHLSRTLFFIIIHQEVRSEERRVGKECVSTCRSRWSPYH